MAMALRQKKRVVTKTKDQILLDRIIHLKDDSEKNFMEMAAALSEVYHSGDKNKAESYVKKWKYKNFSIFAEQALGWSARTAYDRVAIYDCCVTYGITVPKALKLGTGKMGLIAAYSEVTRASVKEISEITLYAEEHPYGEFKEWLSNKRHKAGKGKGPQMLLRRFRLSKQDAELADRGLMRAKTILAERLDDDVSKIPDEQAFAMVIKEWLELVEKENSATAAE